MNENDKKIIYAIVASSIVIAAVYISYQYYLYDAHEKACTLQQQSEPGLVGCHYGSMNYTFSKYLWDSITFKAHP